MERKLAAIVAADVAGYSRLMGVDETGTLAQLKAHRKELIDPKIKEHRGRIVKTTGDGILVEFPSVVEAVDCAVEMQQAMAERNAGVPEDKRITFRVGVNVGDIIVEGEDIYGDGVNVAARLQELSQPGSVCVSRTVRNQVRDKVRFGFEDLGELTVKNIARPLRVFRVSWDVPGAAGGRGAVERARPALRLPDKPSIAVLPFQNLSGDPEQEYFADGVVEDIITALSRFRSLFVIARNSSFTYKGRAVDVKQIGRELGARYALEGSVRKSGNRVRITGQLIDTLTGVHIWADRFEGAIDDIFDLQDQVSASVVGAIAPKLEQAEIERVRTKPTESLNAYDLYLRALHNYHALTRTGSDEALRLLHDAIRVDPNYAVAKALAAYCIVQRDNQGIIVGKSEADECIRLAIEALDAGRDDPRALELAGFSLSYLAHDVDAGLAALDRALALNVNSAQGWRLSGWVRLHSADPRTAVEHFTRAMRLSPLDSGIGYVHAGLATAHMMAGDYDKAVKFGTQALREEPRNTQAHRIVAASLALLGRPEEARSAMRALLAVAPNSTMSHMRMFIPYHDTAFVELYFRGLQEAGMPD
ncbi:MAG TPA: adenylate/guanylate cyclase domain-containing protein [Stellaceae bacterium]|nr:adenylate/guanylate cyclase domain-containing protein [Stellaceae bacterium]